MHPFSFALGAGYTIQNWYMIKWRVLCIFTFKSFLFVQLFQFQWFNWCAQLHLLHMIHPFSVELGVQYVFSYIKFHQLDNIRIDWLLSIDTYWAFLQKYILWNYATFIDSEWCNKKSESNCSQCDGTMWMLPDPKHIPCDGEYTGNIGGCCNPLGNVDCIGSMHHHQCQGINWDMIKYGQEDHLIVTQKFQVEQKYIGGE